MYGNAIIIMIINITTLRNNKINNIDKYNRICAHGEGGTFGPEREHRAVLLMSAFGAPHPDPKY